MLRLTRTAQIFLLCSLLGCGGTRVAQGERLQHISGLSIAVPEGWSGRQGPRGLQVIREAPFGTSYPSLMVRQIERPGPLGAGAEVEVDGFEGVWRYRRLSTSGGDVFQLHLELAGPQGRIEIEGTAAPDEHGELPRRLFERELWPVIRSLDFGS